MRRIGLLTAAIALSAAAPPPGDDPAPSPPVLTILGQTDWSHVTIGAQPEGGPVTVSKAADAPGEPIDYSRVIYPPAQMPQSAGGGGMRQAYGRIRGTALTSGFGMRMHPVLGGMRTHAGIDLAAPSGSPIISASNGVVSAAGWLGSYGLYVSLEHRGGLQTRYAHMSRLNVVPGQQIHRGDVIGYVGSTGRSTGPHLHYEVRVGGMAVNPIPARRGN
jgi:murein DD-endopeptidase MepM/ murein hydrolase activator NlpD